jgi:hypothetical protein
LWTQGASTGAEAHAILWHYAALKRRSSTVLHAFVSFPTSQSAIDCG